MSLVPLPDAPLAMAQRHPQDFQTIRSEGGLLPSDLLRRVLDPRAKLDGTRPEDYGLPQGERLNEVITQSWNRLRKHWAEFRAAAAHLHGLGQEFLNRSPGHLWAIVSNGLRLRVLRDNQALSRQSFLDFDFEAMFAGEVYADFVLLWLMVHATRFHPRASERPDTCWLEQWTKLAAEQVTRCLHR